jgi:long-chain acyl-CoA synthetase
MLICGGAPLSYQHNQFFLNIGLPLYQGYGLTESSPVVAANYPGNIKCGTVGLVYKSTEVKIADDLELLVRGCSVMRGYHKEVEKTQKTIDTYGWLHTGDLASLDNEGYLTLIGRKKELFKTSTGEYVTAIVIEQKVSTSRWIDYALIIADNRPFVTALIYPDYEVLLEYFEDKNIGDKQQNEMLNNFIERAIKNTNNTLNGWEKIRDYKIIEDIPTIEEGVLTPSMKLAREFVMKKYHDEISQMYCNSSN